MKRHGSHFVLFYTEPSQRHICDLAAAQIKNCYVRDIRHGGDPRSRRGEILVSFRRDVGKWTMSDQIESMLIIPTFDQWYATFGTPYCTDDDWVQDVVKRIVSEIE